MTHFNRCTFFCRSEWSVDITENPGTEKQNTVGSEEILLREIITKSTWKVKNSQVMFLRILCSLSNIWFLSYIQLKNRNNKRYFKIIRVNNYYKLMLNHIPNVFYMYICMCVCACLYVCICMCVYILKMYL